MIFWGACNAQALVHGSYLDQDRVAMGWLSELGIEPRALGVTKDGHPKHPLYVPYGAALVPFTGRPA